MKKTCPICEKGCLEERTTKNTVVYNDQIGEIFLYFSVCDHCGSEQTDLEQTIENKREFDYYKKLVDEMSIFKEEIKEGKEKIKTPRGSRIHHRERLRKKRKAWFRWSEKTEKCMGRLVNTPTPCSCYMCGNPRKYFLMNTRQEEKNVISYVEGLKESYKGDIEDEDRGYRKDLSHSK